MGLGRAWKDYRSQQQWPRLSDSRNIPKAELDAPKLNDGFPPFKAKGEAPKAGLLSVLGTVVGVDPKLPKVLVGADGLETGVAWFGGDFGSSEDWPALLLLDSFGLPNPVKPVPNAGCPADPVPNSDPGVAAGLEPEVAPPKVKLGTLKAGFGDSKDGTFWVVIEPNGEGFSAGVECTFRGFSGSCAIDGTEVGAALDEAEGNPPDHPLVLATFFSSGFSDEPTDPDAPNRVDATGVVNGFVTPEEGILPNAGVAVAFVLCVASVDRAVDVVSGLGDATESAGFPNVANEEGIEIWPNGEGLVVAPPNEGIPEVAGGVEDFWLSTLLVVWLSGSDPDLSFVRNTNEEDPGFLPKNEGTPNGEDFNAVSPKGDGPLLSEGLAASLCGAGGVDDGAVVSAVLDPRPAKRDASVAGTLPSPANRDGVGLFVARLPAEDGRDGGSAFIFSSDAGREVFGGSGRELDKGNVAGFGRGYKLDKQVKSGNLG